LLDGVVQPRKALKSSLSSQDEFNGCEIPFLFQVCQSGGAILNKK
jgi:hypothetical protein